ncbi:PQQ-binding-like beta-propeller repeat protein [Gimesia chilikensis]|uniref:PQQ-binding-like beta-propeller repeat protein n=1 Tax=Gimesia chilikensis TaxID=2605989 RepID=UPI00118B5811|nr:PQQ-binding-like beta-propeller repeat protein [Gimesia chilikensis]QDT84875.1 outer membrane biogenesis protein BamB [Gimesia chilikensis]
MKKYWTTSFLFLFLMLIGVSSPTFSKEHAVSGQESSSFLEACLPKLNTKQGICVILGPLPDQQVSEINRLIEQTQFQIYFQSSDAVQLAELRKLADQRGFLGSRLFADAGTNNSIALASNLADVVLVPVPLKNDQTRAEILRVLRPQGTAYHSEGELTKPIPAGNDDWTHPYHRPDNNPQSEDQNARAPYRTQFLADPKFSPMPEVSVAAGGKVFKAFGHIAHKQNQNAILNTLMCINAFNGTILWKRPLPEGFMIHRNTMIGTPDALYMADDKSCKIIDSETGKIRDEIVIDQKFSDGPVWKWMGMQDGVLYALVGNKEVKVDTQKSARRGLGHWPWGMWKGHDYSDPKNAFGFGRTFVAIDISNKQILWHFKDQDYIDSRGVCMKNGRIFYYCPDKFLACLETKKGKQLWKNNDPKLLASIGSNQRAQHYVTGYATTTYLKCSDDYLFFAGPQRLHLVSASAADGYLMWEKEHGNLQLVLRKDGIYAAGPKETGMKLDYATGDVLAALPTRRACTRATGSVDSIFFRTRGGTVRLETATDSAQHIAPMRPPCQDGVIVSNGLLYWGPWMCGCELSLYGHISLGPEQNSSTPAAQTPPRLTRYTDQLETVEPLSASEQDWTAFRGDARQSSSTNVAIPVKTKQVWTTKVVSNALPTAPVVAGDLIFVGDRNGAISAFDLEGKPVWKRYTGGAIYYPPTIAQDRLFVGSADGRVYAYAARTGEPLWSFRVAPTVRWIPVYGKLISTWPVSGGVVVHDNTLYAAAGIAHFDGTHLVALDPVSGELKQENNTSGVLSPTVNSGISLQGSLYVADDELRFLAGGVYEVARYDLNTLKCLNTPRSEVTSQYRTAFYPYYPEYGKYLSIEHTLADRRELVHDASYEGSVFTNLTLKEALPPGAPKEKKEVARWLSMRARRTGQAIKRKNLWEDQQQRRFTSFIVSPQTLLTAGHPDQQPEKPFLTAIDIGKGTDLWSHPLPALAVKGGTAIDSHGRIFVTLENGQLCCFTPE